jgi:hypothetical protein
MPSKTIQDVILYNFLKNAIIGFAVTEKCDVINPVVPTCPGCETMYLTGAECPGLCDDPPEIESVESMLGIDDDDDNADQRTLDHVLAGKLNADLSLAEFVDKMVETCDNCPDAGPDACDSCRRICKGCPPESTMECDDCPDNHCNGCPDDIDNEGMPAPAESLYRQGCWNTLENRVHDLMSEWSLIADECKCRIVVEDCDEIKCTFCDHSFNDCYFEMCPRIHGA